MHNIHIPVYGFSGWCSLLHLIIWNYIDCIPQSSALNLTFHFQCDELNASNFCSIFYVADITAQNWIQWCKKRFISHNAMCLTSTSIWTRIHSKTTGSLGSVHALKVSICANNKLSVLWKAWQTTTRKITSYGPFTSWCGTWTKLNLSLSLQDYKYTPSVQFGTHLFLTIWLQKSCLHKILIKLQKLLYIY